MTDYNNLHHASGRKSPLYRAAAVIVVIICIVQAVVIISLSFALYSSHKKTSDFEAVIKNLTTEGAELKRELNIFDNYSRDGWVYFKHSFYHISSTRKNWQQSREDCLQKGADLVIINSKEENDFMRKFKRYTWIGLTDTAKEGKWKWVDGTSLSTSYWAPFEPNGVPDREEDCAEIKNYDSVNSWNDESCDLKIYWICEKTVTP